MRASIALFGASAFQTPHEPWTEHRGRLAVVDVDHLRGAVETAKDVQEITCTWRLSFGRKQLVELDMRIVAYPKVRGPGNSRRRRSRVHEGQQSRTRMPGWAEGREGELGRSEHRQRLGSGNERGKTLLRAAGYKLARSYWQNGAPA